MDVCFLLKKCNPDSSDLSNYRPICNLALLGKTLKKAIVNHTPSHLNDNGILLKLLHSSRTNHFTEIAQKVILSLRPIVGADTVAVPSHGA